MALPKWAEETAKSQRVGSTTEIQRREVEDFRGDDYQGNAPVGQHQWGDLWFIMMSDWRRERG